MPIYNEENFKSFLIRVRDEGYKAPEKEWYAYSDALGMPVFSVLLKEALGDFNWQIKGLIKGAADAVAMLAKAHTEFDEQLRISNPDMVAKLLEAHLRVEYLLDQILLGNFKECDPEILGRTKLSFVQKVRMLPTTNLMLNGATENLYEINNLRNCFAHNIKFDIADFKSKTFDKLMKADKIESKDKFSYIIKQISTLELVLLTQTPGFQNKMDLIVKNNPGLATFMMSIYKK